jgi:hypothetical protein
MEVASEVEINTERLYDFIASVEVNDDTVRPEPFNGKVERLGPEVLISFPSQDLAY